MNNCLFSNGVCWCILSGIIVDCRITRLATVKGRQNSSKTTTSLESVVWIIGNGAYIVHTPHHFLDLALPRRTTHRLIVAIQTYASAFIGSRSQSVWTRATVGAFKIGAVSAAAYVCPSRTLVFV